MRSAAERVPQSRAPPRREAELPAREMCGRRGLKEAGTGRRGLRELRLGGVAMFRKAGLEEGGVIYGRELRKAEPTRR